MKNTYSGNYYLFASTAFNSFVFLVTY